MFNIFNSESLWIGTDMEMFNKIQMCIRDSNYTKKNFQLQWIIYYLIH